MDDHPSVRPAPDPCPPAESSLPKGWDELWGRPSGDVPHLEWRRLQKISQTLCEEVDLVDRTIALGNKVGAADLVDAPVHRWFLYKEGYSPRLLGTVLDLLSADRGLNVIDPFGGVATTALAGLEDPRVSEVRSVEYSPLAHFVGCVKLSWPGLDRRRLLSLFGAALDYPSTGEVVVPQLAAFSNPEIFRHQRLRALLRARDHVRVLPRASSQERDFFLLGLAAVIEDLSGAMKDGRALRILRHRTRRASSLAAHTPALPAHGPVKRSLAGQWTAMLADLASMAEAAGSRRVKPAAHLSGDARALKDVHLPSGQRAFPDDWADVACFSPPYLNCIDYTEVHKLELWMLGHVTNEQEFKDVRLGTLRSHPSVRFPPRTYFQDVEDPVIDLIEGASAWISEHGARREVGPVVQQYFEDMLEAWREQHRVLKSGGAAACVVANSTFSRRETKRDGTIEELWRLPVLTDVILAHLARIAGFAKVQLWKARDLRPRNVRAGCARESVVVAWKH